MLIALYIYIYRERERRTGSLALIAEAASAAITLAVSLDAADYAYQQCTLIVYVWTVVEWTGPCRGYDRSHPGHVS